MVKFLLKIPESASKSGSLSKLISWC